MMTKQCNQAMDQSPFLLMNSVLKEFITFSKFFGSVSVDMSLSSMTGIINKYPQML